MEKFLEEKYNYIIKNSIYFEEKSELINYLNVCLKENKFLKIKFGIDATFSSLHLGHYIILKKLRNLQNQGHEVILLIGDFTAKIGDPTFKNKTRPVLSDKDINNNYLKYKEQILKILDEKKTIFRFNSEWLKNISFSEIISLFSSCSLNKILNRNDFKNRILKNSHISLHEIIYPAIQAYDSLIIRPDIEIGGSDQLFNFMFSRDLMKSKNIKPQCIMTLPLLSGIDFKDRKNCKIINKMSKSLNNCIFLEDDSYEKFKKSMEMSDFLLPEYFKNVLEINVNDTEDYKQGDFKKVKIYFSYELVKLLDGKDAAENSKRKFEAINFSKNNETIIKNLISIEIIIENKINIVELVYKFFNNAESKSKIKRMIKDNGLRISERIIKDLDFILYPGKHLINYGKKKILVNLINKFQ